MWGAKQIARECSITRTEVLQADNFRIGVGMLSFPRTEAATLGISFGS